MSAYVHRLKCWAENFDRIASGHKRAEVRAEDDRKFQAGELLDLTRTDHDGKPTVPLVRLVVEVLHVERHAGPFEVCGVDVDGGGLGTHPLAVLSLSDRISAHWYDAPEVTPAGNLRDQLAKV